MRFRKEIHFPGTVDEVWAMMVDPEFRRQVALEAGGQPAESTLTETPEGLLSVNSSRPTLDDLPPVARSFVGGDFVIHQEELWSAPDRAEMKVRVPGKPGRVDGTITLAPGPDGGTVQTTDAEIKVHVPVVGGQVEKFLGRILGSLLKTQGRIGAEWLAGR